MEKKKLVLTFMDAEQNEYNIIVDDPKDDLSAAEVRPVMESIVSTEVFRTEAPLVGVISAYFVITSSSTLFDTAV
ncbi:DUF2922 domain-containing protein [Peptoniphilus sp. KCTC 25270]|uniref:DUF2922 domain-containing protein n=1 Tax=Peptoniphilus sp. KCTC 25270 TaxID=2897414 RepID=UPI001E587A9D|nr:DUF2922 domain-containing protein [Peptoniphilus sp. KCTC 25270]MCD1147766.1 DUF2922 domain-containing protein [Peptoniphilus sp. KCTC 25270]